MKLWESWDWKKELVEFGWLIIGLVVTVIGIALVVVFGPMLWGMLWALLPLIGVIALVVIAVKLMQR